MHEGGDHRCELKTREKFDVAPEKLRAPLFVVGQDFVELSFAREADDLFVELVGGAESFGIPRRDFAKHPAAMFFAKNFYHQIQMTAHHADAFVETRFGPANEFNKQIVRLASKAEFDEILPN